MLDGSGRTLIPLQTHVDGDGSARVAGIPKEGREVVLMAEGYVPVRVPLRKGATPSVLELQRAARVTVRVPELQVVVGSRMTVRNEAGRRPILHQIMPGTEGGFPMYHGQAGVPTLSPGLWTVTVTAADGRTWTREVAAVAGETVEVVLE